MNISKQLQLFIFSLLSLLSFDGRKYCNAAEPRTDDNQNVNTLTQKKGIGLGEIIITPRRREEFLHDVPVAVTTFSAETLEENGTANILSISKSAPNVTLEPTRGTNSSLSAFIRGIGLADPLAGFQSGVGLYIDDVYIDRPQGAVLEVYDVDRIEVLRGPQGTLYGRNTIGGAIKYLTKKLHSKPELTVDIGAGTYKQRDLKIRANTPITDNFIVGGSIASFQRDGFGTNIFTGEEHYDKDIVTGRISAQWQPNDNFIIKMAGDYTDDDTKPRSGHRLTVGNLSRTPVLDDVFDTRAGAQVDGTLKKDIDEEVTQGGANLTAQWYIDNAWQLKSISAYRKSDSKSLLDFDSLPIPDVHGPLVYRNRQFSQEFQFSYSNKKTNGVLGAYYLDANAYHAFDALLLNIDLTSSIAADVDTKNWALYSDFTHEFNSNWSTSIGGRYTHDNRKAKISRELFTGIGSPNFGQPDAVSLTTPVPGFVPTFIGRRTDDELTLRSSISWKPNLKHHLYVSFSQGFKSGGFDPRGSFDLDVLRNGFEPETADAYEIGSKSIWFNGMLSTNIAFFYTDYKDIQIPSSALADTDNDGIVDDFIGTVTNAGKAEISGLELEAFAQFTQSFSGNLSFGFIDANFKEWIEDGIDIADQRDFPKTPEITAHLGLRKEWPVAILDIPGNLVLLGSASYRDETQQFETEYPIIDENSYTLYDASLIWQTSNEQIQLGVHGKNLGDKEYKVAGYHNPTLGNEGSVTGFYGDPRTVSATFKVQF